MPGLGAHLGLEAPSKNEYVGKAQKSGAVSIRRQTATVFMLPSVQSDCHVAHRGRGARPGGQSSQLSDKQELASHTLDETEVKASLARKIAMEVENCYHHLPMDFQHNAPLQFYNYGRFGLKETVSKLLLPNLWI